MTTETLTKEIAPDLTEARAIIAALAEIRESLKLPDRRLLFSWRHYLRRTGDEARIGAKRLDVLRSTAAEYGINLPECVMLEPPAEVIELLPLNVPWCLARILRIEASEPEQKKTPKRKTVEKAA